MNRSTAAYSSDESMNSASLAVAGLSITMVRSVPPSTANAESSHPTANYNHTAL